MGQAAELLLLIGRGGCQPFDDLIGDVALRVVIDDAIVEGLHDRFGITERHRLAAKANDDRNLAFGTVLLDHFIDQRIRLEMQLRFSLHEIADLRAAVDFPFGALLRDFVFAGLVFRARSIELTKLFVHLRQFLLCVLKFHLKLVGLAFESGHLLVKSGVRLEEFADIDQTDFGLC